MQPNSVPSSPEYARPPKRARTSLRSQSRPQGSLGAAWQQAGISLRTVSDGVPAELRMLVPQVDLPFCNDSVSINGKKLAH